MGCEVDERMSGFRANLARLALNEQYASIPRK